MKQEYSNNHKNNGNKKNWCHIRKRMKLTQSLEYRKNNNFIFFKTITKTNKHKYSSVKSSHQKLSFVQFLLKKKKEKKKWIF